jgi:hypothetical protein
MNRLQRVTPLSAQPQEILSDCPRALLAPVSGKSLTRGARI